MVMSSTLLAFVSLTVFFSQVQSHTCKIGQEKDITGNWMWALAFDNPCKCTKIVMDGRNTVSPKRTFQPIYVERPLISDDVKKIRQHFNIQCDEQDNEDTSLLSITSDITQDTDSVSTTAIVTWKSLTPSDNSDNEDPAITGMPDDIIKTTNSAYSSNRTVIWTEPTASDNSGLVILKSSHSSGDAFAIGVTNVTYTATDLAGNIATETFKITINDCSCLCPLGMADRSIIQDDHITASSTNGFKPHNGRLGLESCWANRANDLEPWIQTDFVTSVVVTGLQIQGMSFTFDACWVSEIRVQLGMESNQLEYIKNDDETNKIFKANDDASQIVDVILASDGSRARFIRIYPTECKQDGIQAYMCYMRFEVIGCLDI